MRSHRTSSGAKPLVVLYNHHGMMHGLFLKTLIPPNEKQGLCACKMPSALSRSWS
jgi:hypothetical protein